MLVNFARRVIASSYKIRFKNFNYKIQFFCTLDYNEKALTFTNRESYLKKIYVNEDDGVAPLQNILQKSFLVNVRTYDHHALILYAHDNANNFVHLYISNTNEIVYLFNYGREIVNMTIVDKNKELNSGKSIQIAVMRTESTTTLYVNDQNVTIDKGVLLLEEYSNKPWTNPEKEVLSPHRPPAPTIKYFQFNIGGYDTTNLLRVNNNLVEGLVGCVRGLKIGDFLIDLPELTGSNEAHVNDGVLNVCQMICDTEPCRNNGICLENFAKNDKKVMCNCEHTSFHGEFCNEEKGADFSGESGLQRKFLLNGSKIDNIKLQLAFSSQDVRRASRIMLLLQTESINYFLLISLNADGQLIFEEQLNGTVFSSTTSQSVMNNLRHSIYYRRKLNDATLMIDREEVNIIKWTQNVTQTLTNIESHNKVIIGDLNSTVDPRFAVYKSYMGCLSSK